MFQSTILKPAFLLGTASTFKSLRAMVELTAGFWLQRPNVAALEMAQLAGFRLVVLDLEHGAIAQESCDHLIAVARGLGLTVLARVAESRRILIQQALDLGAHGVMLPMIRDAAHAAEVSSYAKYPPLGRRGVGAGRAFGYGAYHHVDRDLYHKANLQTRCHVMIETARALDEVEAIAALATVDGLFIGPSDLSLARGRGAFRFTVGDQEDFATVAKACRSHGKLLGLPAATPEALRLAQREGAAYVTLTDDLSAQRAGYVTALAMLREAVHG